MVRSKIIREIMNFYGLTDYESYTLLKIEPENIKIKNIRTKKLLDLRY